MAHGVGIDLIEIERIERALERRPRLAERLFTADEIAYAADRARPGRHLAARFAAKEAVIKALGTAGAAARDRGRGRRAPACQLHGRAAELAGGARDLDLAHSLARHRGCGRSLRTRLTSGLR